MNSSIQPFIDLFDRDLKKSMKEVSLYKTDDDLWQVQGEISNSGGNLILHIIGNLRHFMGHVLGDSEFERIRAEEFEHKGLSKETLLAGLEETLKDVQSTLGNLSEEQLQEIYPIKVLGYEMTTAYFISHLYGHLTYHLGQVNYHRRILS